MRLGALDAAGEASLAPRARAEGTPDPRTTGSVPLTIADTAVWGEPRAAPAPSPDGETLSPDISRSTDPGASSAPFGDAGILGVGDEGCDADRPGRTCRRSLSHGFAARVFVSGAVVDIRRGVVVSGWRAVKCL